MQPFPRSLEPGAFIWRLTCNAETHQRRLNDVAKTIVLRWCAQHLSGGAR